MRRIFNFFNLFHKELSGVHQAALLLAFSGIASKILALLRDRLLASSFGAGRTLDIYYAAFRLPDFLYNLSLFAVASTALIPIFLEKFSKEEKKAKEFFNSVFTLFLLVIAGLVVVSFFFLPFLTDLLGPGFSLEEKAKLSGLTKILLLSPLFLGLSSLVSSVIQSFRRFFIYALSPILYNLGIISGVVIFYPWLGERGLAWGVVLGALLHFLVQLPSLWKLGFLPRPTFKILFSEIKKLFSFSLPRTIGLTINQLVLWVITALASILASGSIAIFNLSYNLQSIPVALVGLSYSVAAFPGLSRLFLKNQRKEFLSYVYIATRHIVFWSLPISVLFIVLRAHIVRLVLGAGAFSWVDTRLTAAGLAIFSVSVISQGFILLFVRAFYAGGKTLRPLLINLISGVFIILASFLLPFLVKEFGWGNFLGRVLRLSDISEITILILVLAFSSGSILNAFLLWIYFKKDFASPAEVPPKAGRRRDGAFFQMFLASLTMGILAYLGLRMFNNIFDNRTFLGLLAQGGLAGLMGMAGWFFVLKIMKNSELEEILSALKRKFWKTPVVASEPEQLP
ncbi:MAG: Integral membrane protein MviN [Parcubacteria group bacterium GW2011_GWB1_41_6]|nr:MAG: Integral membrane protein MviN [Parcubacteria group bacterium GW2011_GWB1_41_6]